jgi:two-component sensor histidine kinase
VGRTLSLAVELAVPSASVKIRREGRFGELRAENATPLALVLTELVTNAVEHGLRDRGGTVTVSATRRGTALRISVQDDGVGLPEGFNAGAAGLGSQIVQALVSGEMRGRITWSQVPEGGTEVVVEVTLQISPTESFDDGV